MHSCALKIASTDSHSPARVAQTQKKAAGMASNANQSAADLDATCPLSYFHFQLILFAPCRQRLVPRGHLLTGGEIFVRALVLHANVTPPKCLLSHANRRACGALQSSCAHQLERAVQPKNAHSIRGLLHLRERACYAAERQQRK